MATARTHNINEENYNVEVSAGAYWKPLPDTKIYEATIPLTYQTSWDEDQINTTVPLKNVCQNSVLNDKECIILYQMGQLSEAFSEEFNMLNENWNTKAMRYEDPPTVRRRRALDFIGSGLSWCCGVATMQKLNLVEETEKHVVQRLNKINEGVSETIKKISEDSKHFKEYEKSVAKAFETTETRIKYIERYTEEIQKSIKNSVDKQEVLTLNMLYNQYLSLKRIVLLTRALRRHAIINSCKDHKIPSDLVNPRILIKDLNELNKEIFPSGQGLAIQTPEISRYYEIPICDCSFTSTKLFIHIKVPIIQNNRQWQLYELVTTPFAWFNQTCSISHEPLYMAVSVTKHLKDSMRQISGTGLHQCKPYHDKLCYIPRFSADSLQGPQCAKKLYTGATVQEISQYCPMNCHSATAMIISEIDEEIYVLTHIKNDLEISCDIQTGISQYKISSNFAGQGAIKIHLPCNCHLHSTNEIIIPKKFPCVEYLTPFNTNVVHIIPAVWSNLKSFILKPKMLHVSPTFKNLSECLNSNWTLQVPHLNLTSTKTNIDTVIDSIKNSFPIFDSYSDTYGAHSDTLFMIWNIVLSVLVIYLLCNRNRLAVATSLIQMVHGQGAKLDHDTSHDILFGLVCTFFIVFFLCLVIYCIWHYFIKLKRQNNRRLKNLNRCNFNNENKNIKLSCVSSENRTFHYNLEPNDNQNLLSLSPGDKINATIECIQIE